jgi:hypothetical protein
VLKFASISALAALAAAASALAAGPTLSVSATTSEFAAAASTIFRFDDTGQDPTASIDVYAPAGFGVDVDQPIGSTIGALEGHISTSTSLDTRVTGLVKNADPVTNPGTGCAADRPVHDAVWTVNLNTGGATVGHLVLYADRSSSADYAARIRLCLDDPATAGYRLLHASLTINGVFTNPTAAGEYRWTTILLTQSQVPSPPAQSQTIVSLPPKLTLARKLIRPYGSHGRKFVRLSGTVTAGARGVSGLRVQVFAGPRAGALKRLTYATSFERGRFELVAPLKANRVFRATISAPLRAGPLSRCESFALQPHAVCSSLTLAPFTAQSAMVRLG